MIGRAGRPGFDTSGTAVIMTDIKSKSRYEKLSSGLETVESFLLSQLTETLNTEVSQRVITTIQGALDWLKGTFFFHCIRRNPGHYGLSKENEEDREEYLMKRCLESLQALHNSKIIRIQDDMIHMTAESASHVMNHHIVPFEAMKLISSLPYDSGPFQLLQFLSKMKGLHFPVRKAEKVRISLD
jgi:ATP-dependent DNA helicase HFM1/MER3